MFLLDTNIFIDAFRNQQKAVRYLSDVRSESFVSIITKMELVAGARNKNEIHWIEEFLQRFQEVSLSSNDVQDALVILKSYRVSQGTGILDSLIASTAINNKLILVTHNLKHFHFVPNLKVKLPYEK